MCGECNWLLILKCNDCHKEMDRKVHSYTQVTKWGTRTYPVCEECQKKTHQEWTKNGWELLENDH